MNARKKAPEKVIRSLKSAIRRIEALIDTQNKSCDIRNEYKRAVTPYVQSSIEPQIRAVLEWAEGLDNSFTYWGSG